MRGWLVTVLLAVAAVTAGALVVAAGEGVTGAQVVHPAPPLVTPILSPRRAPAAFAGAIARTRLQADLDRALAASGAAGSSCLVAKEAGAPLFSHNPDLGVMPASTTKTLTGLAALRRLGPDFTFRTEVRATAPAVDGVIDGPVWLVGSGDPVLETADYAASFKNQPQVFTPFEAVADGIAAQGVHEIRGGVIGDESRYDTTRYNPAWKAQYITDNEVGPVSALVVNDNFAAYRPKLVPGPAPTFAAGALRDLLRARGVVVGDPGAGAVPAGTTVVASVTSPPLSRIVGEMLEESDNMTAEMLTKELGARFGKGGTWPDGLAVVKATLEGAGLPLTIYAAVDGSGLDRSDRVSCALLLAGLEAGGPNGAVAAALPVAGKTGTLVDRLAGTPAAGRVHAKTGSIDFVAGLVGFVDEPDGDRLEFALVANGLPDRTMSGRVLQDRVALALARYPDAPAAAVLGPQGAPRS